MSRILVIDADSIIYNHAATEVVELPSEEMSQDMLPLYISLYVNPQTVLDKFWGTIGELKAGWEADEAFVTITDSEQNWRLDVDPTYKANRKHTRKPLGVKTVRDHLAADPSVYFKPRLEADDTCGILMTMKRHAKDDMILWSPDKDLDGVPGTHAILDEPGKTYDVTQEMADQWHLIQTVAGDVTDGYPGLPGIGMKSAMIWLNEEGYTWEAALDLLDEVHTALLAKGKPSHLSEEYLIRQARLAKMLTTSLYDFKKQEPILWTP